MLDRSTRGSFASATGSFAENLLLAKIPRKLPLRYRERAMEPQTTETGWEAAIALTALTRRLISMRQRQIEVLDFLLDDHFALWDFANSFPAHRPDAPGSANNELLELIRVGYIALTFGNWFENQTELIPVEQADRPLQDPANWEPTGKNPGYVLELTEQGRQHLRLLGIGPADQ